MNRWTGLLITGLIVGGVALILFLNLESRPLPAPRGNEVSAIANKSTKAESPTTAAPSPAPSGSFREYLVGEVDRDKEHLRIGAVWFPAVAMDGMPAPSGGDILHLEADIRATEANPNGFALGEFVPYLKIDYEIIPASGGTPLSGELSPMVARDGLHYGANVAMPHPGSYRLIYRVRPPSAGGLGRHDDPETGVAPWWEPFEVAFDWEYEPPHRETGRAE